MIYRSKMELKRRATTKKILALFFMIVLHGSHAIETNDSTPSSSAIRQVEKNLFAMLGLKSRPVTHRNRTYISPIVLSLYKKQMRSEYGSQAFPLPGKLTRSANTVRSYTHEGEIYKYFITQVC